MKPFFLLLLLVPFFGISQADLISSLLKSKPQKVKKTIAIDDNQHVLIPFKFGGAKIAVKDVKEKLKGKEIFNIALAYTSYSSKKEFDQKGLNSKRLKALKDIVPDTFQEELITWELIEQTGCTTKKEGANYFHGFIITFKEQATEELAKQELHFIDAFFDGKPSSNPVKILGEENVALELLQNSLPKFKGGIDSLMAEIGSHVWYPREARNSRAYGIANVEFEIKKDGKIGLVNAKGVDHDSFLKPISVALLKLEGLKPAVVNGEYTACSGTATIKFSFSDKNAVVTDLQLSFDKLTESKNSIDVHKLAKEIYVPSNKSVSTIIERNEWSNVTVVTDVTSSMSPFTAQVISWFRRNLSDSLVNQFVFFNDGDQKANALKKVGNTKGIYNCEAGNMNLLRMTLTKAMQGGSGGDTQENDMEAVLEGIEISPNSESILLVADNMADMRDIRLLKKVNIPVHVILCNMSKNINTQYLDVAHQTNGSIHFKNQDITDLYAYVEGNPLSVNGSEYHLKNGKFVMLNTGKIHPNVKRTDGLGAAI